MQIHWRHPPELDEDTQASIEQRVWNLAEDHNDLIDVWIDVEPSSAHHRSGDRHATIRCSARHGHVLARGTGAQLEAALHKAIEKFERNVWSFRERRTERRREARAATHALHFESEDAEER